MRHRKSIRTWAVRITSSCLSALLICQAIPAATAQQPGPQPPAAQEPAPQQPVMAEQGAGQQQTSPETPVLPSATDQAPQLASKKDAAVSQNELPSAPDPQIPDQPQQQAPQQTPAPQMPLGTAAAPAETPTGIPGSRPSGAAIAPAKQKRVRAFVISIGIALAGAAAIGTVVGLSRASHSTP